MLLGTDRQWNLRRERKEVQEALRRRAEAVLLITLRVASLWLKKTTSDASQRNQPRREWF